jgi:uncharacterized membrane protein
MKRHFLVWPLLVLSFFGIADSWYLGVSEVNNTPLTCNIAGLNGCNAVAQSAYSHLFGIPVGLYGLAFFILVFITGAYLLFAEHRSSYLALYILGWVGLLASIAFVCIQFFIIKALCIYCLGSAAITLFICLIGQQLWLRYRMLPRVSLLQE